MREVGRKRSRFNDAGPRLWADSGECRLDRVLVTIGRMGTSRLRELFDGVDDLTVGAEEELLLLDPSSFGPAPVAAAVIAELDDPATFRGELSSAQVELRTGVCQRSSEVVLGLQSARRRLVEKVGGRVRIGGMGAHPFAVPWNQISSGKRYEDIVYQQQLGARLGALAAGLHVHVAVRGADRALAVYNALRGVMPLFTAVAGNAPFIVGRDSGLATVRPKLCDALPRQGVGPRFATWDDFERLVSWGERTGRSPRLILVLVGMPTEPTSRYG